MLLVEEDVEVASSTDASAEVRLCSLCSEPIPLSRIKAMPNTSRCVLCVQAEGDVPLTKRYDDYIGRHGEYVVETYFRGDNQYIDVSIKRLFKSNVFHQPDRDPETGQFFISHLF